MTKVFFYLYSSPMFTGIIEQVGTIKSIDGNRYTIEHAYDEVFELGESIALNGMCSTVVATTTDTFAVDIIQESRQLTTFQNAIVGDRVNLERAAKIGQRNSGHNVTGHIDEIGTVLKLEMVEDFWLLRAGVSPEHRPWLVHKGSVTLGGISLTVSGVSPLVPPSTAPSQREGSHNEAWLEVSIIPYTWEHTTLKMLAVGDGLNVEFDILGKYALNRS